MDLNIDDCFQLGEIRRTHGVNGELIVFIDADDPGRYHGLDAMLIPLSGTLVPHFIQNMRLKPNGEAIVRFEDVNPAEAAELAGLPVYLPLNMLPELTGNKFYYHEITGFRVVDKKSGDIGTVQRVLDLPRQAVLQLNHQGKEVLVPVADGIILEVDRTQKTIHVELPEGLLEIYLG